MKKNSTFILILIIIISLTHCTRNEWKSSVYISNNLLDLIAKGKVYPTQSTFDKFQYYLNHALEMNYTDSEIGDLHLFMVFNFQKILNQFPESKLVKNELANFNDYLIKLSNKYSNNFDIKYCLALNYNLNLKDYSKSIDTVKKINKDHSNDYKVVILLAENYYYLKNFKNAIIHLEKALKHEPDNLELKIHIAKSYYINKNYDKAIEFLEKILKKFPNNYELRYILGSCYYEVRSYSKAINEYDFLIRNERNLKNELDISNVHNALSWLYSTAKDRSIINPKLALYHAQTANNLSNSKNPVILDILAMAHYMNKNIDKAIEIQKKALELAPKELKKDLQKNLNIFLKEKNK